jgi:dTMP kinase
MSSKRPGRWICIDGTEGAGKTTVTAGLADAIESRQINEFSDAPFGSALREAVRSSPHYISGSPLGQSLVFLGDFVELYETKVAPALRDGSVVFTDRGWLSKYAYQRTVLERSIQPDAAEELLAVTLGLVPRPDFTVLLSAPLPVLRDRLLRRDGHCDEQRMAFIAAAARHAREFLAADGDLAGSAIDTDREPAEVLKHIIGEVRDVL